MSDEPLKPPTRLEVKPGESPFLAMARELVERPDGVAALRVMSGINRFVAPRQRAVEQLVEALADQIEKPESDSARAKVKAATSHWEATCGGPMTPQLLSDLREQAQQLRDDRRKRPPPMDEILGMSAPRRDFGYELGGDLGGMEGTWHRLWAAISLDRLMAVAEQKSAAPQLRAEFEGLLGRPLTDGEWRALVEHAHHHCDTVMRPLWQKRE
ncbi:hypothetical protein [Variovorax gossypii]